MTHTQVKIIAKNTNIVNAAHRNTVDYLAGRRSVKKRAEVHRCAYRNACQRKIHEKVREKRGRKPAAMGAYLHPLRYKVMAIFAFSHDASPFS